MPLTYTKRVITQPEQVDYREATLQSPKEWEMFTSKGNHSLTKKGELLIQKLENAKTEKQRINALLTFLRSYRRMERTKTMNESSDTAVRECVWDFFENACAAVNLSNIANHLWESENSFPK